MTIFNRMSKTVLATLAFLGCLAFAEEGHAAYQIGDGDRYLKIGGLLQAWTAITQDKAPDGDGPETEFYLRRMRLMVYGQINDKVNFFVETDNPNFGKGGDLSMNTFIQDAYLELNLHRGFQIDIGMLLVPFSHHGMQGATTLLGLDYHGALVRYPLGSHKVWRDFGVIIRGLVLNDLLDYRVGIFNGSHGGGDDPRNPSDWPRFTGRLTFNIFDAEGGPGAGGFYYDGIYIKDTGKEIVSAKKILSFGASVDWQRELNVTYSGVDAEGAFIVDDRKDYLAVAGDVFWDIPLGAQKLMSLNGQVNFYYYDHGDRDDVFAYYNTILDARSFTGIGISSEIGFRYDAFQPVVLFDWFRTTESISDTVATALGLGDDPGDFMGIYGGFNYWLFAHSTTFKLQVGSAKVNGGDWTLAAILQAQLLF